MLALLLQMFASIQGCEAAEAKDRSDPRFYVGTAIAPKLRELEKRFSANVSRNELER